MTATVTVTTAGESAVVTYAPVSDPGPVVSVVMPAPNGVNDTAALVAAAKRALAGPRTRIGPSGQPQAVVVFEANSEPYRIAGYVMPSDLCIEVDAGATWQLPAGTGIDGDKHLRAAMLLWGADGNSPAHISNVSLVTTGSSLSPAKQAFLDTDPALAVVDVASCFTVDLDAEVTGATNNPLAIDICNVTDFEVGGMFQIHNDTNGLNDGGDDNPTSSISAVAMRAAKNSPLGDVAGFMQPRNGVVGILAAWRAPRGYGPIQINALINVVFGIIASVGGTACRIETDGPLVNKNTGGSDRGAIVDGLVCGLAICAYGNRAASLTPHGQTNGAVHILKAIALYCFQAVVASRSNKQGGSFASATVDSITATGGQGAQGQGTTNLWVTCLSDCAISIDGGLEWLDRLHLPIPTRIGSFATAK